MDRFTEQDPFEISSHEGKHTWKCMVRLEPPWALSSILIRRKERTRLKRIGMQPQSVVHCLSFTGWRGRLFSSMTTGHPHTSTYDSFPCVCEGTTTGQIWGLELSQQNWRKWNTPGVSQSAMDFQLFFKWLPWTHLYCEIKSLDCKALDPDSDTVAVAEGIHSEELSILFSQRKFNGFR